MIRVQIEDFSHTDEYKLLRDQGISGAIVTFAGLVRDFANTAESPNDFELQHYPGMTEKVLDTIEHTARRKWQLEKVMIIHRVGKLSPGDQIVFVGVSSKHRKEAFEACAYIMDTLKTQAPFWKKENGNWVDAKDSDQTAADRWLESGEE